MKKTLKEYHFVTRPYGRRGYKTTCMRGLVILNPAERRVSTYSWAIPARVYPETIIPAKNGWSEIKVKGREYPAEVHTWIVASTMIEAITLLNRIPMEGMLFDGEQNFALCDLHTVRK